MLSFFFFFNDTATTEIYTLSLHDALPISEVARLEDDERDLEARIAARHRELDDNVARREALIVAIQEANVAIDQRSEEHTSELQSLAYLVCRLLLEKKKKKQK